MKKNFKNILIVLLLAGFTACKKDEKPYAGADVKGIWIGTWQGDWGETGIFNSYVDQNNTILDGNVFIRFDLPNQDNYSVEYTAELVAEKVRGQIEISIVDIMVKGDVNEGQTVSGTFNTNIELSGNFSSHKITATPLTYSNFHTFNAEDGYIDQVVIVDSELWVRDLSRQVYQVYETSGNKTGEIEFENQVWDITYDGQYFWCYTYDYESGNFIIQKRDGLLQIIDILTVEQHDYSNICYYNSNIYTSDNFNRSIKKISLDGIIIDSVDAKYLSISTFTIVDGYFLCYTNSANYQNSILYCMDFSGEILHAYAIDFGHIVSMAVGNEKLYLIVENYESGMDGPSFPMREIIEIELYQIFQ